MTKINQRKEKRLRNEAYAKRYEPDEKNKKRKVKLDIAKNWCRIKERDGTLHPLTCSCDLPPVSELLEIQRKTRRPKPPTPVVQEAQQKRRFH